MTTWVLFVLFAHGFWFASPMPEGVFNTESACYDTGQYFVEKKKADGADAFTCVEIPKEKAELFTMKPRNSR